MNFKKFISGVSAFAIAASAFAGMAVTASASAYTSPYTLSSSEEIKTVLIGNPVTEDDVITSVTPEDFSSYDTSQKYGSGVFSPTIGIRDSGIASADTDNGIYGYGTGLAIPKGANGSDAADYSLVTPVTSGKVVLRGDMSSLQRNEYVQVLGKVDDGAGGETEVVLFRLRAYDGDRTTVKPYVYQNGTLSEHGDGIYIRTRDHGLTLSSLVVDIDKGELSYTFDGYAYTSKGHSFPSRSGTATISGLKSVTAIGMGQLSNLSSGYNPTFDNVSMYTIGAASTSKSYTVNYVNNNQTVKSETRYGAAGDSVEYSADPFETGGKRYYYVGTDITAGVNDTISADNSTVVNVTVREADTYTASLIVTAGTDAAAIDGQIITTQAGVVEGYTATLYHNRYIVKDNVAYKSTTPTSGGAGYDNTASYLNQTAYVTYNKFAENVAYFSEAEDISGWTVTNDTARMSGGQGGIGTTSIALEAGLYTVYAPTRSGSVAITNGTHSILSGSNSGSWSEYQSSFALKEAASVTVTAAGSMGMDYILIVKNGEYDSVAAPSEALTEANWVISGDELTNAGYSAFGNTLTYNGTSVYGYSATVDANGYSYGTVKVTAKIASGDERTATYTGLTFSGAATFYVISDTVLDTANSSVYCE